MTFRIPGERIEIATYADGRRELDVTFDRYVAFDATAKRRWGMNLLELTRYDSKASYDLIRNQVGAIALGQNIVMVNGEPVVEENDTPEEKTARARQFSAERMPASYEGPIRLSLGIYPTEEDELLFGQGNIDRVPILDISVDPPNYS